LEFRLPKEAEWEYACREGGKANEYGHSQQKETYTDHYNKKIGHLLPPDSTGPNALGLYNMSGGVWEWMSDLYQNSAYKQHQRNTPLHPGDNSYHFTTEQFYRVERGGIWNKGQNLVRCGHRDYDSANLRSFFVGARLVLSP